MPVDDGSLGWRWLVFFGRLINNQCESAGDSLALNRLALARNGGGLQVRVLIFEMHDLTLFTKKTRHPIPSVKHRKIHQFENCNKKTGHFGVG